jgi:hypothetical protein
MYSTGDYNNIIGEVGLAMSTSPRTDVDTRLWARAVVEPAIHKVPGDVVSITYSIALGTV